MQNKLPRIKYSTENFIGCDRCESWSDHLSFLFSTMHDKINEIYADVDTFEFNNVIGGSVNFSAQSFIRSKQIVSSSSLDHYLVHLYLSGGFAGNAGAENIEIGCGDIAIFDLDCTLNTIAAASKTIAFLIPKSHINRYDVAYIPNGMRVAGTSIGGQLLGDFIKRLYTLFPEAEQSEGTILAEGLSSLVACIVKGCSGYHDSKLLPLSAALRHRALSVIDRNLNSRDLTPSYISRELNTSRSHLYRSFAGDGGVAQIIQDRRLAKAYQILREPCNRRVTVACVAERLGFSNPQHFSRLFRDMYGTTPANVRDGEIPESFVPKKDTISEWICSYNRRDGF